MKDTDLHAWAMIEAELAEIEGMKADNLLREQNGESPAYGYAAFRESADTIRRLAESFEPHAEIDRLTKELVKSVEHSEQYRRNWLSLQDATGEQCLISALTWIRELKEENSQLRTELMEAANLTDSDVDAEISRLGIDMKPAFQRLHKMIDDQRTKVHSVNEKGGRDMNHTPGPWEVLYVEGDKGFNVVTHSPAAKHVKAVCECWPCLVEEEEHREELLANARLIAAAPDLLEALALCLEYIEDNDDGASGVMEEARAAIKKARGEA